MGALGGAERLSSGPDLLRPNGYYNLERMLKVVLGKNGKVLLCGTCMDARGLRDQEILEGCQRSTLDDLTRLSLTAEKTLVF